MKKDYIETLCMETVDTTCVHDDNLHYFYMSIHFAIQLPGLRGNTFLLLSS